ncbi:Uncharacterized protein SCF082_LOCUS20281 [Durusdinium trenchii]|uniref:Uncharacterized protein n=1 Tax=Durusdinium trenchii TaxID=1381693 RepID=A0ABP0L1D0_9DINO
MTIFGWGLEKFIPEEHLKPGEPLRLTPSSVRDRPHLTIAADEESVGFKAGYNLAFNAGLRVYMEPEYCHPAWNNLKNSIKVAGFHPTLLKATLMSHVNHSPYGSGKNQQTKEEVCCHLVESMKVEDFQRLCEDLEFDRGPSGVPVPTRPEELLSEPTIAKRGIYAKYKSWFQILQVMRAIDADWSISSLILDEAQERTCRDQEAGLEG